MASNSHDSRVRKYFVLGFGVAIAAGLVLGIYLPANAGSAPAWLVFPVLLVLMGGVMLAGLPWWRALDDVQRQGQTHSWYWGSMLAGLCVIMWLIATTGRHSDMSLGAAYLFIAQGIGFALVWTIWRLRGRGASE